MSRPKLMQQVHDLKLENRKLKQSLKDANSRNVQGRKTRSKAQ